MSRMIFKGSILGGACHFWGTVPFNNVSTMEHNSLLGLNTSRILILSVAYNDCSIREFQSF